MILRRDFNWSTLKTIAGSKLPSKLRSKLGILWSKIWIGNGINTNFHFRQNVWKAVRVPRTELKIFPILHLQKILIFLIWLILSSTDFSLTIKLNKFDFLIIVLTNLIILLEYVANNIKILNLL